MTLYAYAGNCQKVVKAVFVTHIIVLLNGRSYHIHIPYQLIRHLDLGAWKVSIYTTLYSTSFNSILRAIPLLH